KWTVDICIDQSKPWPLDISNVRPWPEDLDASSGWEEAIRSDPAVTFGGFTHQPGSALIFSGSSQGHGRRRIFTPGAKNVPHLVFLHLAPAGCLDLIDPRRWAERFGVPEIADVIEVPATIDRALGGAFKA